MNRTVIFLSLCHPVGLLCLYRLKVSPSSEIFFISPFRPLEILIKLSILDGRQRGGCLKYEMKRKNGDGGGGDSDDVGDVVMVVMASVYILNYSGRGWREK